MRYLVTAILFLLATGPSVALAQVPAIRFGRLIDGRGLESSSWPGGGQARPGQADGVEEVQRVAREQLAAGADWIKMYGSTGSAQDVTGYQTFSSRGSAG